MILKFLFYVVVATYLLALLRLSIEFLFMGIGRLSQNNMPMPDKVEPKEVARRLLEGGL